MTGEGAAPRTGPRPRADSAADALAAALADVAGDQLLAVLLFGSHLVGAAPSAHSAYDFVLIVREYLPFYERLHAAGANRRSPAWLAGLARVLAPNILAVDPGLPGGQIAKVMILTMDDFARALSPRAPDHYMRGRLVQTVAVLRAEDAGVREEVEGLLAGARRDVLRWAGPWLPERFAPRSLARRMLEVSYAGEIRPEAAGRVAAVFEAQEPFLAHAYREVLEQAEREGLVVRVGPDSGAAGAEPEWRLARPPSPAERLAWRLYFARSKARATARWAKHVATFDDWLTYIQRKVERRTGMHVEVTPLERRFALILLWPKIVRVLWALRRSRAQDPEGGAGRPASPGRGRG